MVAVCIFRITLCAGKWLLFRQIVSFLVPPLISRKWKSLFAKRTLVRFISSMRSHMLAQNRWQEEFFWTMLTRYWNSAGFCIVLLNLVNFKTIFCCGFKITFITGKSQSFVAYSYVFFQAVCCFEYFPLTKLAVIRFDIDMFCGPMRPHITL